MMVKSVSILLLVFFTLGEALGEQKTNVPGVRKYWIATASSPDLGGLRLERQMADAGTSVTKPSPMEDEILKNLFSETSQEKSVDPVEGTEVARPEQGGGTTTYLMSQKAATSLLVVSAVLLVAAVALVVSFAASRKSGIGVFEHKSDDMISDQGSDTDNNSESTREGHALGISCGFPRNVVGNRVEEKEDADAGEIPAPESKKNLNDDDEIENGPKENNFCLGISNSFQQAVKTPCILTGALNASTPPKRRTHGPPVSVIDIDDMSDVSSINSSWSSVIRERIRKKLREERRKRRENQALALEGGQILI